MCVSGVMHYKNIVILNQKVLVEKMIPVTEAAEERGAPCMVTPHRTKSLIVLRKLLVQFRSFANERYCLQLKIIVTFRRHASFIIKALCLVDSLDIYK